MAGSIRRFRWLAVIVVILAVSALPGHAQQFRNIASFSVDYDFDTTFETTLEDVFLAPITPAFTLEAKVRQISGSDRSLTLLAVGPVFVLGPSVYTISLYGIGFDGNGQIVHEMDLQGHYETAGFRIGGGVRGQFFPSRSFYYLIPSVGGWAALGDRLGLQATWFFSWNSDRQISNAFWSEVDYQIAEKWRVKLGGTVDYGDDPVVPDATDLAFSGITGFTASLSPTVNLRYHFEYFARIDAPDGIRNLVLVDWRF